MAEANTQWLCFLTNKMYYYARIISPELYFIDVCGRRYTCCCILAGRSPERPSKGMETAPSCTWSAWCISGRVKTVVIPFKRSTCSEEKKPTGHRSVPRLWGIVRGYIIIYYRFYYKYECTFHAQYIKNKIKKSNNNNDKTMILAMITFSPSWL